MNKQEKFKNQAAEIMGPKNMQDFLGRANDSPRPETARKKATSPGVKPPDVRLSLVLRTDLHRDLLEEVWRRKRDPHIPTAAATQRAVIEEALSRFFENNSRF